MKRGFIFTFIIILVLSSSTIIAQETTNQNQTLQLPSLNFGSSLNQPINLPPTIETLAKLILGVKTSPILTTSLFVVLSCIWIMLFIILSNTLELTPFFHGWTKWIGAACITIIIAVTGVIETVALFLIKSGTDIVFFEEFPAGAIVLIAMLLLGGAYLFNVLMKKVRRYEERTKVEITGWKEGLLLRKEKARQDIAGG